MPTSFSQYSYAELPEEGLVVLSPRKGLKHVVIIPAYKEKSLLPTLKSLEAAGINRENHEVIILINQSDLVSEKDHSINQVCYNEAREWSSKDVVLHLIWVTNIPKKNAGVGLARKLAMDEATKRMNQVGRMNGYITNLDADCTVATNYFEAIDKFFLNHPKVELANIHYEHQLELASTMDEKEAIIAYESHLRYFIQMQEWMQLPYAFQTVGSSFSVRVKGYQSVGGMNKRKAGEDFYFIHKFTKKGTLKNLTTTTVFPSSRSSTRVPFGTGKAVLDLQNSNKVMSTYHPKSFYDLNKFVLCVNGFFETSVLNFENFPRSILQFLELNDFENIFDRLQANAKSKTTLQKAFYQWFDAFKLMKFMHFSRDNFYPNIPIIDALNISQEQLNIGVPKSLEESLLELRAIRKRRD